MSFKKYLNFALHFFFLLIFFASAVGKLLDNRGFAEVIGTYQMQLPDYILLPLALSISLFEGAVFIFLILRRNRQQVALLLILIHAGYTALAVMTNLRGLHLTNCGCFGVFWGRSMTWNTVYEDLILTLLSVVYWKTLPNNRNETQS